MKQFKRVQVILLPTEDKVNALKGYTDKSLLFKYSPEYKSIPAEINYVSYFHLYIISDDEIKVGDHVFNIKDNHYGGIVNENNLLDAKLLSYIKKIIATTNTSLNELDRFNNKSWNDLLPQPSQQFIEKYIESYNKGEIITDVLVEYETLKTTPNNKHFGKGHIYAITNNILINKNNTINIKLSKDSWNREEVIELLKLSWKESDSQYDQDDYIFNGEEEINVITYFKKDMDKWIEENI